MRERGVNDLSCELHVAHGHDDGVVDRVAINLVRMAFVLAVRRAERIVACLDVFFRDAERCDGLLDFASDPGIVVLRLGGVGCVRRDADGDRRHIRLGRRLATSVDGEDWPSWLIGRSSGCHLRHDESERECESAGKFFPRFFHNTTTPSQSFVFFLYHSGFPAACKGCESQRKTLRNARLVLQW